MKQWVVGGVLLLVVIALLLYARSTSRFEAAPTDVVPTQLPQPPTEPPPPVPEPSPVLPQPIPDKQATATESDEPPESLSMSPFTVTASDLTELEKPIEPPKLKKLEGPLDEDIEMERRQTYSEWSQ